MNQVRTDGSSQYVLIAMHILACLTLHIQIVPLTAEASISPDRQHVLAGALSACLMFCLYVFPHEQEEIETICPSVFLTTCREDGGYNKDAVLI